MAGAGLGRWGPLSQANLLCLFTRSDAPALGCYRLQAETVSTRRDLGGRQAHRLTWRPAHVDTPDFLNRRMLEVVEM